MNDVMRFNMFPSGQPNPERNGLYVRHADYAALEAENAALKHRCGMFGLELESAEERRIQAERQAAILRQHKTDYMEAAEGTRKALEAECERLRRDRDRANEFANTAVLARDALAAELAAIKGQEPDCDRSACGDFSPGRCDNPDCSARRDRKPALPAAPEGGEV